jgi:hypothetical protein
MYNGMWFRGTDSEQSCIIVCVLGVQKQCAVMYNSMCFRGTKTVSGHV